MPTSLPSWLHTITVDMENPSDGPIVSIAEPGVKAAGPLLYAMRKEVADLLGRHQTSFPGAQPVSFARQHLEELTKQECVFDRCRLCCAHADAITAIMFARNLMASVTFYTQQTTKPVARHIT